MTPTEREIEKAAEMLAVIREARIALGKVPPLAAVMHAGRKGGQWHFVFAYETLRDAEENLSGAMRTLRQAEAGA